MQADSLVNVTEYHFSKKKKDFATPRPAPAKMLYCCSIKTAGFQFQQSILVSRINIHLT